MAVTVADLAIDLRILATPPADGESTAAPPGLEAAQVAVLARILATAQVLVTERASSAPEALRDQAVLAIAAYLYDRPSAGAGTRYANAWANSGASEILSAYVTRRARVIGAGPTAAAAATPAAPGGGVSESRVTELIEEHRANASAHHTPEQAGNLPMPATPAEAAGGVSTTIRSWTSALIRAAINAVVPSVYRTGNTDPIPADKLVNASGARIVNVADGRLPGAPVGMRLGWNQTRVMSAAVFTRAGNHPIDGAQSGMSDGLAVPPFPPALDTDPTLYLGIWLAGDSDIAKLPSGFPAADKRALTVGGTAGHYYPSSMRLAASVAGSIYRVPIVGPRILTEADRTEFVQRFEQLESRVSSLESG